MNKIQSSLIYLILFFISSITFAQEVEIKGNVTDAKSGEPLIGVHLTIVGDVYGTISNYEGNFVFTSKVPPPFELHVSYMGYEAQNVKVTDENSFLELKLKEQYLLGQEVVVSASRIEENILWSSVSVEKMSLRDINQLSTTNFYDGLSQLKGVDMNVHGLTFKLPNTRGFKGT